MNTITRGEAIALLRRKCLALVDEEHSLCDVASRLGILCGGFAHWELGDLKRRHDWIVKKRPGISRKELEDLANRWMLARQASLDTPLACDVQEKEKLHPICRGWGEFTEEDLGRFCKELTGEDYQVAPEPAHS